MRIQLLAVAFSLSALAAPAFALQGFVSDDQVAQQIIKESIANYSGPCACPYNHARNGSSCGRRSAYSRAGGYDTVCYREDVSADDITAYREQYGLAAKQVAKKRSQ
ncbi:hypothetical protein [Pseudomonas oryzihabitans]|uniref:hypothetical protein n=1 Tax=Pseudomonas oryzihabitans TaxID=47885 RepID=UPI00214F58A9|nr:hypothetical protein [Pseudomonas psychrotolerans]UUW70547.1 hypothetical protein NRG74_15775 [Pseudomonas psychrotolerans]